MRELVAAREGLRQQDYVRLAGDLVPMVRAALAKNPSIDESLVRRLAEDRGHDVQRSLAYHPGLPLDVLARLARSTELGAQLLPRVAAATTAEVTDLATAADPTLRMLVALRRDLPDAVRKALREIARHPNASLPTLLTCLADTRARPIAAARPELPSAVLVDLLADENRQVVTAAADPFLPPH